MPWAHGRAPGIYPSWCLPRSLRLGSWGSRCVPQYNAFTHPRSIDVGHRRNFMPRDVFRSRGSHIRGCTMAPCLPRSAGTPRTTSYTASTTCMRAPPRLGACHIHKCFDASATPVIADSMLATCSLPCAFVVNSLPTDWCMTIAALHCKESLNENCVKTLQVWRARHGSTALRGCDAGPRAAALLRRARHPAPADHHAVPVPAVGTG